MVTLLRAPNPSPMTLDGTNGYVIDVGPGALIAIDPGIDDAAHIAAFVDLARERDAQYVAILVTHGHPDHFPGALALRSATNAPVFAHAQAAYPYDRALTDGETLRFEAATVTTIDAPGHARDHLVFWLEHERALFTGDVVIGSGTVVVAPPSGDMRAYQATLERLLREYPSAEIIYGGHGPPINDPRAKLEAYIAHRKAREAQIVTELAARDATIPQLVERIYADVDPALWPAAARQVLAYLIALGNEGRVRAETLDRAPTEAEARLLHPDLGALARGTDADLVRAELGFAARTEPVVRYALV